MRSTNMVARHLRQWLRGFATSLSQAHRPQKFCRLNLEDLEARATPSILFGNTPGLTVSDNNGPVLSSTQVRVVFWGTGWNSSGGLALRGQVINSINSLAAPSGTYFASTLPGQDLGQYRPGSTSSRPVINNYYADSFNSPGLTFTSGDVFTMLSHEFGSAPSFYYYVIPDPNSTPTGCGCAAEHTFGTIGSTALHYGFSRNLPLGTAGQLDDLTILYSHEMVESITDPEGTALQVNPRGASSWNEIADGEAQLYGYRLNGVWTQAYWSRADGKFTVPTGQSQNFFVSGGVIPRVLTVNGDQLINHNDSITVDANGNDVRVTLNGEVAQFEPGQISSIVVNTQTGNDTVNVERTLAGIPVTVNLGGGADTVNVSPSARNLGNIQGAVTIHDGAGVDTLNVDDQANAAGTTYTLTTSTVQRSGSALINYNSGINFVNINGGTGNNAYNVNGTEFAFSTTLNTGIGADTVNVENVNSGTFIINEGGSGNETVNISPAARNLNNIQGSVTVNGNTGTDTLNVNDQNNAAAQTYTLGATSLSRIGMSGVVNFGTLMNFVTLNGGSGADTYTVNATGAINLTTVNTGAGNDTVNVETTTRAVTINEQGAGNETVNISPAARNLNNIQGSVTVNGNTGTDTLNVNDQNNAAAQTYTLGATSLSRTGMSGVVSFGTAMNLVTLNGGSGASTYNINGTGAINLTAVNTGNGADRVNVEVATRPLRINEGNGASNDTVNVSPAAQNLNNIQGAVTVNGNFGTDTLVINDQNNAAAQTYSMTATSITRTGAALISFATMSTVTLNGSSGADTYNVTGTGGMDATTLNDGSGGNIVNVLGTSAVGLTVNTGAGDTVVVSSAAQTLDPIGTVSVNDASGTATVIVDDSGFADTDTYAITDTTVTAGRLPDFVLSYAGIAALGLNTGSGGDTVTLTNASNTLDGIGNVSVNDASGTATLVVDDSGFADNESYAIIDPTVSVARLPNFLLTYSGIAALNLYTGPGSDTFDIDSTSVSTAVTAGAGGNIFHLSPFTQYLASIVGPLTLNGGGSDILEFFDANDPGAETFSFDSVPSTLTLGSTGGTIASFAGMGGGVYVMTNGFSTPDDQSGTVIFDPAGGPPSGSDSIPGRHETPFGDRAEAQVAVDLAHVGRLADGEMPSRPSARVADFFRHAARTSPDPWAFLDLLSV